VGVPAARNSFVAICQCSVSLLAVQQNINFCADAEGIFATKQVEALQYFYAAM